jgi:hypothetical protein
MVIWNLKFWLCRIEVAIEQPVYSMPLWQHLLLCHIFRTSILEVFQRFRSHALQFSVIFLQQTENQKQRVFTCTMRLPEITANDGNIDTSKVLKSKVLKPKKLFYNIFFCVQDFCSFLFWIIISFILLMHKC